MEQEHDGVRRELERRDLRLAVVLVLEVGQLAVAVEVRVEPEAVLGRVLGVEGVRARPPVAVAEVDDDRRAGDRRLDLRPGRARAVDLHDVGRVLDRLGVHLVGVAPVAGRDVVRGADDDRDLGVRRRERRRGDGREQAQTTEERREGGSGELAQDVGSGTTDSGAPGNEAGADQCLPSLAAGEGGANRGMVRPRLALSGRRCRCGGVVWSAWCGGAPPAVTRCATHAASRSRSRGQPAALRPRRRAGHGIGERRAPVAHRLARGQRRGLEHRPQGRCAGALPGGCRDLLDLHVDARRRAGPRAPSPPGTRGRR